MLTTMNADTLYQVFLQSDIDTAINIHKAYPKLIKQAAWKDKFYQDFKDTSYFETWTWKENYLAKIQPQIMFLYKFVDNSITVNSYIYNNDQMIIDLVNVISEDAQVQSDYVRTYSSVIFDLDLTKRYLAISPDELLLYTNSFDEAVNAINGEDDYSVYAIIDLKTTVPYFLKYGIFKRYTNVAVHVYEK